MHVNSHSMALTSGRRGGCFVPDGSGGKNFEYSQKNRRIHQEQIKATRLVSATPFIIPYRQNGTFFFSKLDPPLVRAGMTVKRLNKAFLSHH